MDEQSRIAPPGSDASSARDSGRIGQVIAYFDAMAVEYARRYASRGPLGEALRIRRDRVLALLDPPAGRVLDVGCGPGEMGPPLLARGYCFWGIDLSWGMVAEAHRRHGHRLGMAFAQAGAERLPFGDASFDAVLSTGVMEYTSDEVRALGEMSRVLRHGGVLIFTLGHRWSPYSLWMTCLYYPIVELIRPSYLRLVGRPLPPPVHRAQRLYAESWSAEYLPSGLTIEDLLYSNFKVLPAPLDLLLPRLDVALLRRLQVLGRGPLRRLGTALVVKARKA